jgi:hypothetical protein
VKEIFHLRRKKKKRKKAIKNEKKIIKVQTVRDISFKRKKVIKL